jgi:hypothetical protein
MPNYIPSQETDLNNQNKASQFPQIFLPSGNIFGSTSTTTTNPPPSNQISPIQPTNLSWPLNNSLSNGNASRQQANAYGINDFTIVNPYIHYYLNSQNNIISIDPTSLLEEAPFRFNIYSSQFRNIINSNE